MTDDTDGPAFRYTARTLNTTHDTRHEAVGALARYGDWAGDAVVPITDSCVVRQPGTIFVGPDHIGDKYWNDREKIPTTAGVTEIAAVSLVRHVNGREVETEESWWETDCPVCGRTHEVDGATEDNRREVIDAMLDCCGIEWVPPRDWIEDCDICGDSHRASHECTRLSNREPFPDPEEHHYDCAECDWSGDGDGLIGPGGLCPQCETASVRAKRLATDGGTGDEKADSNPVFLRQGGVRKRMRCSGQIASRIDDAFVTVEQLVAAVESDTPLTDRDGIGPKTAEVIGDWWDNRFEREAKMSSSDVERTGSKTATIHFHRSWADAIGNEQSPDPDQ